MGEVIVLQAYLAARDSLRGPAAGPGGAPALQGETLGRASGAMANGLRHMHAACLMLTEAVEELRTLARTHDATPDDLE